MNAFLRILFVMLFCLTGIMRNTQLIYGQSIYDQESLTMAEWISKYGYKHKTITLSESQFYHFPALRGPEKQTQIPLKKATSWKQYSGGGKNRLCLFLIDTTSNWLALVNGFNANAIPFRITTDINQAKEHQVILVYPGITSQNINFNTFNILRDLPKTGAALLTVNPMAPSMGPLFGFEGVEISNQRNRIRIDPARSALFSFCVSVLDREIRIGNQQQQSALESFSFSNPELNPFATYEDGSAAIVGKYYNPGIAIAMGIDVGRLASLGYNNRDADYQNTAFNGFEPTLDVLFRFIKQVYLSYAKFPVVLGNVPNNMGVSIMITHNLSSSASIPLSLLYADVERQAGIAATYFIQTKYVNDGVDQAFFTGENMRFFRALKNMGMDFGSHSVSRTPFFSYLPWGTGKEKYPDYLPFVSGAFNAFNETLLGELRVSKFLIEKNLDPNVRSFRSGFLDMPPVAYQALPSVGYQFSSNAYANDHLTHLPYQPFFDDQSDQLLDILEIPITIDDKNIVNLYSELGKITYITDQVSRYGGMVNLQLGTEDIDNKVEFLREYIDMYKPLAWFGTVSQYGAWIRARYAVQLDVTGDRNQMTVRLNCPQMMHNLPLHIPANFSMVSVDPPATRIRSEESTLILHEAQGVITIRLRNQ